jgi:hopene-associated glycosyltransferase HpnB
MDVIVVLLSGLSLAAWIHLIGFRGGFWRADQRLEPSLPPAPWPGVVAIIPARNEERSIEAALAGLLAQDYPGAFSIVVVDDASTDRTVEIARKIAASAEAKGRIEVLAAPPLGAGWTGKSSAVDHGINHAMEKHPESEFFFLTDADTVHGRETVKTLFAKAKADDRDLVSLMVRLNCEHLWERLLIPAFVFFFQMLYPFNLVNDDDDTTAAAAGACIFIRKDALERAGGIAAIRGELIDDCALAHIVKRSGGKIWLGLAETSQSLRG